MSSPVLTAVDELEQSPLRRVFFGPNGLRPGWGALLYVILWVTFYAGLSAMAALLFGLHRASSSRELTPQLVLLGEIPQIVAAIGATLLMSRIEHRPVSAFGFAGQRFLQRFLLGAVLGFTALSLVVLLLFAVGVWHCDGVHLHGAPAWSYAALWAIIFTLVGVAEESTLRGYLLATLIRGIRFWPAAVVLSLVFGALHLLNGGEDPFGIVTVVAAGLLLSFSVWRTKSLATAFGIHSAWDWAQSYFYGTADSGIHVQGYLLQSHPSGNALLSGGSAGPEGSVLALPVMLALGVSVHLMAKRRLLGPSDLVEDGPVGTRAVSL